MDDDPLDTKSSCDICVNWKGKLLLGLLIALTIILGIIVIITIGN